MKPLIEPTTGWMTGMARGVAANVAARREQFGFGLAFRERKRRFQRGVKAVFAGIGGQVVPIGRCLGDAFRKGQVIAGKGVIAKQLRAEAVEVAATAPGHNRSRNGDNWTSVQNKAASRRCNGLARYGRRIAQAGGVGQMHQPSGDDDRDDSRPQRQLVIDQDDVGALAGGE